MGARSGNNYLSSLRKLNADIWIGGERVRNVTTHPAFERVARSIASLYDLQLEHPEAMTYRTENGDRAGLSFIQPRSVEEVAKRGRMMKRWADFGCGMLGRAPDYLNASIAAMAGARQFFADADPRYGDNIVTYYHQARRHDWCATHTLVNPRASRGGTWGGTTDANVALRLVEKTGEGIIVNGCRLLATLAPITEELLVFPSTVLKVEPEAEPFALAFAINCDAKGLKFLCRETYDLGRSHFDHPLASRFEEMDALAIFDHVLVPWERVFLCGDPARCNALFGETNAVVHMMHQVAVKDVAKAEFMLGLAVRCAEASDAMNLQHVRERLAEMIIVMETMRACLRAGEADAAPDRWGLVTPSRPPLDALRNVFPRLYPRMVEIIQLNNSSSLMALPSAADFDSPVRPDIDRYLAATGIDAHERVALFRLAWDATCSAFAGRQTLYERFFFGDPVKMASALVANTNLAPLVERVEAFLKRPE